MALNRVQRALAVALVPLLLTTAACKKKVEPPPPPPPPPPPVEVRLQVSSVTPATVDANNSTMGRISGSSFQNGATVEFIGPTTAPGERVSVVDSNAIALVIPKLPPGTYDVRVVNPDGESATLRSGLTARNAAPPCQHVTINFDFDSSSVRSDAKSMLDSNMSCFQSTTGAVRIEGHADERGTTDYNLALGQRRADSTKKYLTKGGVAASRVSTVSYGEERPASSGHDESAWAQNRRAEINVSE